MQITNEVLTSFVGGQMEIQNQNEGYLFRGEVKTAKIENNNLHVDFVWLAKMSGESWVKEEDRLDYDASLDIYTASNIGPSDGEIGGGDRICFYSFIVGETVILYPPNGSKLDPVKVKGLQVQG